AIKALDTTLDWLLDFLSPAGELVIWVDPQEPAANRKLRAMLEKHGLIVEAGTMREHGSAVFDAAVGREGDVQGRLTHMQQFGSQDWRAARIREWLLLLLRFAVTRDVKDEVSASAMAD